MKAEKQIVIDSLLERINNSPFVFVADYSGMKVPEFAELRNRLRNAGSEFHVDKNTFVKRAAEAAGLPEDFSGVLNGQTAIVTGDHDVCAVAKVMKNFAKEFNRPSIRAGILDGALLNAEQVEELAALPPKEELQAKLLGLMQQPASMLVRLMNEPGSALARVLQAKADQG